MNYNSLLNDTVTQRNQEVNNKTRSNKKRNQLYIF